MADEYRTGKDEPLQQEQPTDETEHKSDPIVPEEPTDPIIPERVLDYISEGTVSLYSVGRAATETIKELTEVFRDMQSLINPLDEVKVTLKDLHEMLVRFRERWGKIIDQYGIYTRFIADLLAEQPEEWLDEQPALLNLQIVKDYIAAYNIKNAPKRLTQTEQARLRAFFSKYIGQQIAPELSLEEFYYIVQGKGINALTKAKTQNLVPAQIGLLGDAVIKVDNDFTLTIKKYAELKNGIRTTAYMLLDCLVIHFTETGSRSAQIRLPLEKYMEMRGLKDKKEARAQVIEDMEALKRIEYEARERIRGKWVHSGSISIFGGTGLIKNSVIYFNFNADFYNQLKNYCIMEYPKELLKANPKKNPHAYYFGRYIAENYRMNEGKERQNCITIQALLEQSPELPSYETVMSTDRAIYKRIIYPVIRDLDSIGPLYYDLVSKDGNIIDDPQGLTYDEFKACKIIVDYSDFPKHEQRIAKRKKLNVKSTNKALKAANISVTK